MARGLFGSTPKRSMTDPGALSRRDRSTAGQLSARSHSPSDRRGAASRAESEWHESSEKGSQYRGWRSASPQFDTNLTETPEDIFLANQQLDALADESMIGIALGSPRLASSYIETTKESPDQDASIKTGDTSRTPLRRKSSKWKKIGSLFRGKQSAPRSMSPIYQIQVTEEDRRDSAFETKLQSESVLRLDGADVKKGSRRERMTQVMQSPQEIQPGFSDQRETNDEQQEEWPIIHSTTEKSSDHAPAEPVPFLHVDIPDIHMERYSIMFGNVLGNDQSSRLLARRSKTLESLAVPGTEPSSMSQRPSLLQRRATSPARSTAYPSLPAHPKARKYLDSYTLPRGPSPLSKLKAESIANSTKLSLADKDSSRHTATPSLVSQVSDVDESFISATSVDTRSDYIDIIIKGDVARGRNYEMAVVDSS